MIARRTTRAVLRDVLRAKRKLEPERVAKMLRLRAAELPPEDWHIRDKLLARADEIDAQVFKGGTP